MTLSLDVMLDRPGFALRAAFQAREGEVVAVLGPNGAGKSTLMHLIAGVERPHWGTIAIDGALVEDAAGTFVPPQRRPVAMAFQDLLLFPHLTSVENVAFPLRAAGQSRVAAVRSATEMLERVGAVDLRGRRPAGLSGGEAQRVSLARALVSDPRVLILDEPTAALDVSARGEIRALLADLLTPFTGVTLLVTHDAVDALTLADRIVIVEGGAVTQVGTSRQIRESPLGKYAADLVGVNLYRGALHRAADGTGIVETAEGRVVVMEPEVRLREGTEVLAIVSPADVSVHRTEPEGSARNVFRGVIVAIDLMGERARVRVGCSPPTVAEVTLGSVSRLRLQVGLEVWLSFKAIEARVVPA